jgi:hypothetical protein
MCYWQMTLPGPSDGYVGVPQPAVHRTIIYVDVAGFAHPERTDLHQVMTRRGLYRALDEAFARSGVPWRDYYYEDRGDGVLILLPPEVPKSVLSTGVPLGLARALARHNQIHDHRARIRLRVAIHAGEVRHDEHGVSGAAVILAARLLEASALKRALGHSPGVLATIASARFFDEVIRHEPASTPASYRRVRISVKETKVTGWIRLLDHLGPVSEGPPPRRAPRLAFPQRLPAMAARLAALVTLAPVARVTPARPGMATPGSSPDRPRPHAPTTYDVPHHERRRRLVQPLRGSHGDRLHGHRR